MVEAQLPLPQLRDELLRLAAIVRTRQRSKTVSQATSELAALLHEAQRRKTCKAWGYDTLGKFARSELQLTDATFAKYRKAGENLCKHHPQEFDALLAAVAQGTKRPSLLEVSKLETLDRLSAEARDALHRGGSLRKTAGVDALDRFGSAAEDEKVALRALDALLAEIADVRSKVGVLDVAQMTADGRGRLLQKLDACNPAFAEFWEEMDRLSAVLRFK